MQIFVKVLQGEEHSFDVTNTTSVSDLKGLIANKAMIPIHQQSLLVTGKPLREEKALVEYGISEGSKITLVILKGESSTSSLTNDTTKDGPPDLETEMRRLLRQYYNESDSEKVLVEFMKEFNKSISSLNFEDMEKMATSCLQEEGML